MRKLKSLMLVVAAMGVIFSATTTEIKADVVATATIPTVSSLSQAESINAISSTKVMLDSEIKSTEYTVQVTLNSDSFVLFAGGYANSNDAEAEAGLYTYIEVFTNNSYTVSKGVYDCNKVGYLGDFLSAGTYYLKVKVEHGWPYKTYEGNSNITVVAIPVSEVFKVEQKVSKNKNSVTVSFPDILGEYTNYVQYTGGSIGLGSVYDKKIWKWCVMSDYFVDGKEDTVVLANTGSGYSFKANKNGKYTIMIDAEATRYSVVIDVKGIDKVKPVIKGVKNNKKYKKAVTIKFSDKASGIKSAKLNGKKIKSGKKVKKAGKYKLVVTDKAGNKKTIKFWIK